MRDKIDDTAYNEGRKAFKRGNTLKELVGMMVPTEEQEKDPEFKYGEHQNAGMSRMLGFADAFLEFVRGGMRR